MCENSVCASGLFEFWVVNCRFISFWDEFPRLRFHFASFRAISPQEHLMVFLRLSCFSCRFPPRPWDPPRHEILCRQVIAILNFWSAQQLPISYYRNFSSAATFMFEGLYFSPANLSLTLRGDSVPHLPCYVGGWGLVCGCGNVFQSELWTRSESRPHAKTTHLNHAEKPTFGGAYRVMNISKL